MLQLWKLWLWIDDNNSYFACSIQSVETISYDKHSVFTGCNSDCFCSASDWDPICGDNGITYVSPCLAGCTSSAGSGKNTVSSHYCVLEIKTNWIICLYASLSFCLICLCATLSSRSSLTVAASVLLATLQPIQVSAITLKTVTGCSPTSWLSQSSRPSLSPLEEHQATWSSSGHINNCFKNIE